LPAVEASDWASNFAAILPIMNAVSRGDAAEIGAPLSFDDEKRSAIIGELERIVADDVFRTSKRSRQFLSYVVRQTLDGNADLLKERTIGIDVFGRSPEGISTENSLVRKQAGDLRRRLDEYYKSAAAEKSLVRILLPLGSYVPEFHFSKGLPSTEGAFSASPADAAPSLPYTPRPSSGSWHMSRWAAGAAGSSLVIAICLGLWIHQNHRKRSQPFVRFWEPVSASSESVVVCVAKPVVYIPSRDFFRKYSDTHNREFGLQWQRLNERLPKNLDMVPTWSDMQVQEDYGIARGDAEAAYTLAALFTRLGKPSHLRIGEECSLADLRSAPVTLVGAFNNRWTIELMAALHFRFSETDDGIAIVEQVPNGRVWKTEWNTRERSAPWNATTDVRPVTDYAIISRLKNSQTGQHMTIVAGMTGPGTQAAAELVSNPEKLDQILRGISAGWESKNLQIIIRVNVPNGITPITPQAIATYSW
jgi:hypothetical protein